MRRLICSLVAASLVPLSAWAGAQEERFVTELAHEAVQAARAGHGARETRDMRELLERSLDVEHFVEESFGEHWRELGFRQKDQAQDIMLSWSAVAFAGSLMGREQITVEGSEDADGVSRVRSIVTAPGADLADPITVEWLVGRHMGRLVVLDVVIAGKSSIESQRSMIDQLFEISDGEARAVFQGLSDML